MLKTFQSTDPNALAKAESLILEAVSTKFDYNAPIEYPEPILSIWSDGKNYPIAGRGMLVGVIGMQKSGKSFVLGSMMESFLLGGEERLNFEFKTPGSVLFFDNEQSSYFYKKNQKRLHDNARIRDNTPKYSAYHLRRYSPAERLLIIEELLYTTPGVEAVVLDGLAELATNFNEVDESTAVVQTVMKWCFDLNILALTVLHTNKTTGTSRGHLGAIMEQKADAVLLIKQDKRNEYTLSNPVGRFITFEDMAFSRDTDTGNANYLNGKQKHNFL